MCLQNVEHLVTAFSGLFLLKFLLRNLLRNLYLEMRLEVVQLQ